MRSLMLAAVVAVPALALAGPFHFERSVNACVDASGARGFNDADRGPCVDFSGRDLSRVNLENADLRGARFDGADLTHANLMRADLEGATFVDANLSDAVLTGAQLERTHFVGSRLVAAHLEYSSWTGAVVEQTDLRNACLYLTHFGGADLRTATFSQQRSMLDGAQFEDAIVTSHTLPYDAAELQLKGLKVLGRSPLFVER